MSHRAVGHSRKISHPTELDRTLLDFSRLVCYNYDCKLNTLSESYRLRLRWLWDMTVRV